MYERRIKNKKINIHPLRIGFRLSEPDFTRTLDFSQLQNPQLSIAKPLVLFNQKIKIPGKLLPLTGRLCQRPALKFLKSLRYGYTCQQQILIISPQFTISNKRLFSPRNIRKLCSTLFSFYADNFLLYLYTRPRQKARLAGERVHPGREIVNL